MVQISNAYRGGAKFNSFTSAREVSPKGVFTVSIAGRWYNVETNYEAFRRDAFSHDSFAAQRQSINLTNIAGEGTVNTDGLWRREQNDWSLGSGQLFLDRPLSVSNRFYKSKGINPWTKWELSLLHDTVQKTGPGGTLVKAIAAGVYVYAVTSTGVFYTSDYSTWQEVKDGTTSITAGKDIATNGTYVWVADGTHNVKVWSVGSTTQQTNLTDAGKAFYAVSWQLDKLFAATGSTVSVATSSSALTPLWTHPSADFRWTSFATCQGAVYMAGSVPSSTSYKNGAVYFSTYNASITSTNMNVPIVALPLTNGEYVTALYGYLNFMFIGSNHGVRMAQPSQNNYLTAGALIPALNEKVTRPVTGFTGSGQYVWFTWNNYDGASSGLGRMNLSSFVDALEPAYASDLMITTSTATSMTLDWCPITNGPLISNTGSGIYTEATTYVTSGFMDSGRITYGIPDDKIAAFIHFNVSKSVGDVYGYLSTNGGDFSLTAMMPPPLMSSDYQITPSPRGEYFNVKLVLEAAPSGSQVTRWTLRSAPAIATETLITQVIDLADIVNVNGIDYSYDPYEEYMYIDSLRRSQQIISYLEGPISADVIITDCRWVPYERRDNFQGGYRGNLIVKMKTINGFTLDPQPTY
ncbi:MAG: hypothetical protein EBS66_10690 [Betaproteobacteria bacterium]|nr:hypothetical protein [Betaproteobacteria bacterium]